MLTNSRSSNCVSEREKSEGIPEIDLLKEHKQKGNGWHIGRVQAVCVIYEALLRTDDWSPNGQRHKNAALCSALQAGINSPRRQISD